LKKKSPECKIYHHDVPEISTMKKTCILLVFIILTAFSCSKDNVKPSEDFLLSNKAIDSIKTIKSAYERKNKVTLQKRIAPPLAEDILKDFSFMKSELVLTPRMVKIKETSISVTLNWQGSWWVEKGRKLENRGVADLVLDRETMKLTEINGDNPFSVPILRSH